MNYELLKDHKIAELREMAKEMGISGISKLKKVELIEAIINTNNKKRDKENTVEDEAAKAVKELVTGKTAETPKRKPAAPTRYSREEKVVRADADFPDDLKEGEEVEGVLEISEQGYGFLRFKNFMTSDLDAYVSQTQIRRFSLRTGDKVLGVSKVPPQEGKSRPITYIKEVNGMPARSNYKRLKFDDLIPMYPDERFVLENGDGELSLRLIDLISPIGKGQRGLIAAPPKAGKTMILQKIAKAINEKYKDVEVMVLLIDERPEEVTEMSRSIDADVIYSTFDEQPSNHIKVAEMVLQRAKALVEMGKDVVVLLDSITRLARAYNLVIPSSGRTLSGGFDPAALHKPKRFFGAARNIENGGSLTILATGLIETGSRMDDVIFEEFKGTGNMELTLSRALSEKRIFPAIDLRKSSTRREDLLLNEEELQAMWSIRRKLENNNNNTITEKIIETVAKTKNNKQFIELVKKNL